MIPYLFINPKAGLLKGCQTAAQVKQQLKNLKQQPDITIGRTTTSIEKFISKVKQDKPSHVYIAGGDGTIATIIKGLMDYDITFGIIPTGSMNNIAKSLQISDDIDQAVAIINKGQTKLMDFGKVNGEVFIESVGIGLMAQIMNRVGEQDSKKEVIKVVRNTIAEIITTDTIPVTMKVDQRHIELETVWLTITNTGQAAAATVDPTSDVHDRQLEVVYCEPIALKEIGHYAIAFINNAHIQQEKFHRYQAKHIELKLPQQTHVHVDGILRKWRTVTVDVLPATTKILAP